MPQPKLMMLDEPSMGLSPILVQQVFDIIREINQAGTSILLVEQNAFMALQIATRAYVMETGHVVLSGDTKYSKRVELEATGADLLVHEVAAVSGDPQKVLSRYPAYRAILDHHTDPQQAGALFAKARPKLAVYSHIVLPADPADGVPAATPDEIIAQTRLSYDGPLIVGADMMQFVVSDEGVAPVAAKR